MKATGKIKVVLAEREVETDRGTIRKQDFILEVKKPNKDDEHERTPDTLALTLTGDKIDTYDISVGDEYSVLYDSNARVSNDGTGNEAFDRKIVFKMFAPEY